MKKRILKNILLHLIFISTIMLFVVFIPCPLFKIFQIPCPLCGMTRATIAFFQGNFELAFALHPLFIIFPFVFLFLCHYRIISKKINKKYLFIVIIYIFLAFAITYFVRDKSILFVYQQPFFR